MLSGLAITAIAVALLLLGAMAGVFFAYSNSVVPGLDAADPRQAVPAMQSINRTILNPAFFTVFIGGPIAAAAAALLLLPLGHGAAAAACGAGAVVYLLGAFAPTAAINVPLNNTIDAAAAPEGRDEAARVWAAFSPRWTRWNTVRAVASAIALLCVVLGGYLWAVG
ncbi:putative membrane protein [Murinocardiopsis flavida]|uniref:Putative membrane protein n=1 Tax=Murinocardiopsis flavida TaxID=645275 RepID=A0A2P8DTS7_9ACTN|nr:anthrone oxygenase family protein [Murinocardiopsis flavida]PSL00614.1 putative membrane protein [Murinocardiopsis flavida]